MSPRRIASFAEIGDASFAEIGDAWAAEHDAHVRGGKAAHAGKEYVDDWRVRYGTAPLGDPLRGLPPCPCGKTSYPTREAARRANRGMTAYACPLGHPVYHLHARGRSTRERGLRA